MNNKYKCLDCNYSTGVCSNYHKHLRTKKHIRNEKNSYSSFVNDKSERGSPKSPKLENKKVSSHTCKYCNKTMYARNKNRHLGRCKKYAKYKIQQENTKLVEELTKNNSNIIKELKERTEKQALKIKELEHEKHEYFDVIKTLAKNKNNITIENKGNMFYVMQNFTDAHNYEELMNPPLTNKERKYITDNDALSGCFNLITSRCINGISLEKRPLHCVDSSRNKYLLRMNNDWNVDNGGEKILRGAYPKIKEIYEINKAIDYDNHAEIDNQIKNMGQIINLEKNGKKRIIKELNRLTLIKNNIKAIDMAKENKKDNTVKK